MRLVELIYETSRRQFVNNEAVLYHDFFNMSANSLCRLFWAEDDDIGSLKCYVIRNPLEKKDDVWMAVI